VNIRQSIERFGLIPTDDALSQIRDLLAEETAKEAHEQGAGNTEFMKLCCIQLFSKAQLSDVLLIWNAKTASMDADCSIDIQLLCGAGLEETKAYLKGIESQAARAALSRILKCEASGDFDGFSVEKQMGYYQAYFEEREDT
jgi:hypothetical protein